MHVKSFGQRLVSCLTLSGTSIFVALSRQFAFNLKLGNAEAYAFAKAVLDGRLLLQPHIGKAGFS